MDKKNNRLELVIGIAALVAGIVALFFSWQANQLAERANEIASAANELAARGVKPNVVVLDAQFTDSAVTKPAIVEDGTYYACESRIRLSNLGGAPTDIIGVETVLDLAGQVEVIESNSPVVYAQTIMNSEILDFESRLLSVEGRSPDPRLTELEPGSSSLIAFPHHLEASTTVELYTRTSFVVENGSLSKAGLAGPMIADPRSVQFLQEDSGVTAEFIPLRVGFRLRLASGEETAVQYFDCAHLVYFNE